MTAGTWHVSPTLVERYASGHLDYAAEASLARPGLLIWVR